MTEKKNIQELFTGLNALMESCFPKICPTCGKVFPSMESFIEATEDLRGHSGLMESIDDDENPIVELYRNCPCGSTLMNFCYDRRDTSERGQERRDAFDRVLQTLMDSGIDREKGIKELRSLISTGKSTLLKDIEGLGDPTDTP